MSASTKSQAERLWLLGGGLLAFVLLLIGYFFFISPQRSGTSSVRSSLDSARLQNTNLQTRINALRTQSKNMNSIKTQLAAAQKALPSTSGVPDFLRTLQSLGNSTLTHVTSVTVGAPTDVSAVASGTATTNGTSPSASAAPAAAPSSPTTMTGAAATAPAGPSVYGLTISAQVNGSTNALNQFLDQLQSVEPRAILITQITESMGTAGTTGADAGSGTSLQLTIQAFVAPTSASENANLAAASR